MCAQCFHDLAHRAHVLAEENLRLRSDDLGSAVLEVVRQWQAARAAGPGLHIAFDSLNRAIANAETRLRVRDE
jgi:hypothetical protein